jgi:hypothetical protein
MVEPGKPNHETFEEELERRLRALPADATNDDALQMKREIYERRKGELQALVQVGIDQADRGELSEFDVDAFLSEMRGQPQVPRAKRESA